jgi:ApbE superfamily uncharacterized protein (UPF0280 family)
MSPHGSPKGEYRSAQHEGMPSTAQRQALPGQRWHLQHGPIDIVLGADGEAQAVHDAHEAAWQRFSTVLQQLVAELPTLRRPIRGPCPLQGVVARRMWAACRPFHGSYITPMAAVAGAVAQELIGLYQRQGVQRAWVNNGGDIAVHLAPGQALKVGIAADPTRALARGADGLLRTDAQFELHADTPVRGIATSGWQGRSFSLGIADSVTVLARTAAEADAAATIVANAVDVEAPGILRQSASTLKDDSDLGDIPVTVQVPTLPPELVHHALAQGLRRARELRSAGLLWSAALLCQGWSASLDDDGPPRRLGTPGQPRLVQ